ncbi:hypothetical protein [Lederbergia graminis]|uniref:Lipoprotein n=1 Tax=Lederbergia graminis TaxID=735518 RepID=A0ABW0LLB8_9BACI
MYKKLIPLFLVACIIYSGCSNKNSSPDWKNGFVVLNDGAKYIETLEYIDKEDIGPSIGKVTFYSDNEFDADINGKTVSSNTFTKGTKIYEIKDVSKKEALAVQVDDTFVKIQYDGIYGE